MQLTDRLLSLARWEYGVLRSCVEVVDHKIVTPFAGERAAAAFDRARDAIDEHAGRLLSEHEDVAPGRVDDREEARGSSEQADGPDIDDPSAERAEPAPIEPEVALAPDQVEEVTELAEEYLEAEEGHLTGELAENEELRRVQAELRAKHAVEQIDEDGQP